jgi:signal transduction histidine kinase
MSTAIDIIESRVCLPPMATGKQIYELFNDNPDLLCVAIVGNGHPLGLISRNTFFTRFGDEIGRAVYEKRPATILMEPDPVIIDANAPLPTWNGLEGTTTSNLLKGFIVVRDGQFVGVSSLLSLYRATQLRTGQLEHQLTLAEEARRAAYKADQAKLRFLASMSHELRTPLNAILGYSELIVESADADPQIVADAARITGAGQHLLSLINEVVDFARIDSGKVQLAPELIDVADWAQKLRDLVAPLAIRNRNSLKVVCAEDVGLTFNDPLRLRQCLLNLCGNACKFTEDGEIVLRIERRGAQLHFFVSDTGIGMSCEQLERLFQPFAQADASIHGRFGGSGLGLAITRDLARLMDGDVTANSRAGIGSTFEMVVPVNIAAPEQMRDAA